MAKKNRGGRPPGTPTGRATARERYYTAQAERQELMNRKARGEVIDVVAARRTSFELARLTRDRVLAVPARVSADIAVLTTQAEVEIALEAALREALIVIADEAEAMDTGGL